MEHGPPDSRMSNTLGSFPVAGPVTYLTDDPIECQRLMKGPFPSVRAWFHGTSRRAASVACIQGLAPGCWIGAGDKCCGVLGYDSPNDFLQRRGHLWIVEIAGPALDGDLKAWWVPPSRVRGVWHLDSFSPRNEFAATSREPLTEPSQGCACPLSGICLQQQTLWRSTWAIGKRG
jgi:hypothetical protein